MIWILLAIPTFTGAAAIVLRHDGLRRTLLIGAAIGHAAAVAACWYKRPGDVGGGWLGMDAMGLLFLSITSVLFLCASVYAVAFLAREQRGKKTDFEEGFLFENAREATFTGCLLLFLATMTLVALSKHFGMLWVAVEATTLASAPLIMFHRHHRSLEATWKYLLICSVGIAIALLGNFFLAASLSGSGHVPMTLDSLHAAAAGKIGKGMNPVWLKAAFVLFAVGYGTKMGLAPLHTWLPDAHSESPSVVSALLSGTLLNCAFVAILRSHSVCVAAGLGDFSRDLLLLLGMISMTVAAVFIIGQTDFKRMLAYSSVEHMGILAAGVGLGGSANLGAMFHSVNHSLTKGMLFMVAGNILSSYKTKQVSQIQGVLSRLPVSGVLWVAGFLAITGSPPFGTFLSEMTILKAAFEQGRPWVGAGYLLALVAVFVAMATIFLRMTHGIASPALPAPAPERKPSIIPPLLLGGLVLLMGLYTPPALVEVLRQAASLLSAP